MSEAAAPQVYCSRCLTTFAGDPEQCPNMSCQRKRPGRGWGQIFAAGEVFDRNYSIHRMLAMGGAGVTYTAREIGPDGQETGPKLAIKVLLAARDQGPYVRRLSTEAQIIQELDHPNIVQYLGFVHRAGHSPYLITQFEEGGSLLDHMRRVGTLPVRRASGVARQICLALEKAHERGIIHRDLKPENVLLASAVPADADPVVRVADFGIAKVQGGVGGSLTRVGAFVGTPHYAAPEQFVGGAVTEAADVYAVGALVYFCITARHVVRFADRLEPEEGFQLLQESLPPKVERAGEDPLDVLRINRILASAMNVDPSQRCSVVELSRMLGELINGLEPAIPVKAKRGGLTHDMVGQASVLGLAGAITPMLSAIAATEPAAPSQRRGAPGREAATAQESRPTEMGASTDAALLQQMMSPDGAVSKGAAGARRTTGGGRPASPAEASGTLDALRTGDDDAPTPRRGGGGLAMMALGLVLFVGVAVVGGGALVVWRVPAARQALGLSDRDPNLPKPVELSGQETDAAMRKDWRAIDSSLKGLQSWLGSQCKVKSGADVALRLVIEPDGKVRSAENIDGSGGETGECVSKKVKKAKFTRTGTKPVRVELTAHF